MKTSTKTRTPAGSRSRQATIAAVMARLEAIRPGPHWVVSCYLKIEALLLLFGLLEQAARL